VSIPAQRGPSCLTNPSAYNQQFGVGLAVLAAFGTGVARLWTQSPGIDPISGALVGGVEAAFGSYASKAAVLTGFSQFSMTFAVALAWTATGNLKTQLIRAISFNDEAGLCWGVYQFYPALDMRTSGKTTGVDNTFNLGFPQLNGGTHGLVNE
jgi:hypothetical protein